MFTSTHKLDFEQSPLPWLRDNSYTPFKIGTVEGLYCANKKRYEILAVINKVQGNGHFTDVLEWFTFSAQRDGYALVFLEMLNESLSNYLISSHQFQHEHGTSNLIKNF